MRPPSTVRLAAEALVPGRRPAVRQLVIRLALVLVPLLIVAGMALLGYEVVTRGHGARVPPAPVPSAPASIGSS